MEATGLIFAMFLGYGLFADGILSRCDPNSNQMKAKLKIVCAIALLVLTNVGLFYAY